MRCPKIGSSPPRDHAEAAIDVAVAPLAEDQTSRIDAIRPLTWTGSSGHPRSPAALSPVGGDRPLGTGEAEPLGTDARRPRDRLAGRGLL